MKLGKDKKGIYYNDSTGNKVYGVPPASLTISNLFGIRFTTSMEWINEKTINGKVYTLWRDSDNPKKQYIQVDNKKPKLLNRKKGEKACSVWNDLDKLTNL